MNKKKLSLIAIALSTMAVTSIIVGEVNGAFKGVSNLGVKADKTYTLVYDKDHTVVDAQIKTSQGNTIWTKANFNASFTANGIEFTKYGYVQNLTPLNGIKSVAIVVTSGKYVVSHGFIEPDNLKNPEYFDAEIDSTQTINYSTIIPNYFRVQALEAGTIESITVTYSCDGTSADDYLETASEGIENVTFAQNFNTAVSSFVTDTVCQTEFAVSKRALKIKSPTVNESVSFNVAQAVSSGYTYTDEDNYFIMDVKSSNSNVGTLKNAFMLDSNVKDFGWKDPTDYIELKSNPGWYRYYFKMELSDSPINLSDVSRMGLIFSKTPAADEVWYVDNVHFGKKPMTERTIGADYDFRAEDRVTIAGHEVFSFDFKVTDIGTTAYKFGFGNWNQYFDFSLNADGTRQDGGGLYQGCYLKSLLNGWKRMYVSTALMNRVSGAWKKWDYTGNNNFKLALIRGGNTASGYFTEPRIESDSMKYIAGPSTTTENYCNVTVATTSTISFTYKFIDNTGDSFSFMLSNNWETFFGYFEFDAKGVKKWGGTYDGVVTEQLGKGVIRVTMTLSQITKTSGKGAPTAINMFRTHSWGTGVIMFSGLEVTPL